MNCDKCQHKRDGGVGEPVQVGNVTVWTPCMHGQPQPVITIDCSCFMQKLKLVDPAATCGDCAIFLTGMSRVHDCAKDGAIGADSVACVQIETKEVQP